MNILIDIGHPAHVHLMKHTYHRLVTDGHEVWVTTRDIPLARHLLEVNQMPYTCIGQKKNRLIDKFFSQFSVDRQLLAFVKAHHIEVGVGSSVALAHVSKLSSMKSIILDDDDDAVEPLFVKYAHPFADVILSPDCLKRHSLKTVYYPGYHDLAYLHPNVFTPDPSVLQIAGLSPAEPFFILRFNAFKAHHDIGESGLSLDEKRRLVRTLLSHGKVFITSEGQLEPEFQPYQLTVPPEHIHSLMYYATMFVGDSQSMTSEAAVLGTPALKCNTFAGRLAVPNELEQKYDLCYAFHPSGFDQLLCKINDLLSLPNLKELWREKTKKLYLDKVDVADFLVRYVEQFMTASTQRILIDVGHPAHVHMYKCFAQEMQQKGNQVLFVCRNKEFAKKLLEAYCFRYREIGKKSVSLFGKVWDLVRFDYKEWQIARKFGADVIISHGSITASHAAWLLRIPHITFEDTFNMEQVRLYLPFTKVVITSDYLNPLVGRPNQLSCKCYNELLYLHPNRFAPKKQVLNDLGIRDGEKFVIMRFVSWGATHDIGHAGMSDENRWEAVSRFEKFGRVFISSERELPSRFEKYRFPLSPQKMHDVEAFATLVFGESATMASEAAVLGVPGIFINNSKILYTKEQEEKYHLCYNFTEAETDQQKAIEKGVEILSGKSGVDYQKQRQLLLQDKIDVTAFFVWLVENYPQSIQQYRSNPQIQNQFL